MKKEPIVYHGLLHDDLNIKALIEAQANEPAFKGKINDKKNIKVKTLTKKKNK